MYKYNADINFKILKTDIYTFLKVPNTNIL